jgi:hypothetical protein
MNPISLLHEAQEAFDNRLPDEYWNYDGDYLDDEEEC